jgi:hypothetical protein
MFGIYDEREDKNWCRLPEPDGPEEGQTMLHFSVEDVTLFIKLKDNKTVSGFSQTQQYFILFYLDVDMFRSLDYHQAIFTKLRKRYMQCLPINRRN